MVAVYLGYLKKVQFSLSQMGFEILLYVAARVTCSIFTTGHKGVAGRVIQHIIESNHENKNLSLSLSLLVVVLLSLVTIKACNPVVSAEEDSEISDFSYLSINQELLVLANTAHEIVSNFMTLSPEEQRNWVQQAESLLDGTTLNRPRGDTDYREFPYSFVDGYNADELMAKQAAFDELFIQIMPSSVTDKLIVAAQSILEKRPELVNMDEEELMNVLTAEIDQLFDIDALEFIKLRDKLQSKINSDVIFNSCDEEFEKAFRAANTTYRGALIACTAAGLLNPPAGGVCAAAATVNVILEMAEAIDNHTICNS